MTITGSDYAMGKSLALIQNSIWYKRAWKTTAKYMLDGFIYGLVTAATFGWLWPWREDFLLRLAIAR